MVDSQVQTLRYTKLRIERLHRWINGIETEFPVSFQMLDDDERMTIRRTLGDLTEMLDSKARE